jgi:hypothetical protein
MQLPSVADIVCSSATWRSIQRGPDVPQRQADLAAGPDEGDPAQHVPRVPALVAGRPLGADQAQVLVVPQR